MILSGGIRSGLSHSSVRLCGVVERVGPQCATVSPSKNPASASTSSPALRILIEDLNNSDGFVVDFPRIWSVALAGAR